MKMVDDAKPTESPSQSNAGEYTDGDLEQMLEAYVQVKTIEKDPKILAMLKDYALSKNKQVAELFDDNKPEPVKSLADIKKIRNAKIEKGE